MKTKSLLLVWCLICFSATGFGQTVWKIGSPNEEAVTATLIDGTLTINGTGAIKDFGYIDGSFTDSPWYESKEVVSVIIKKGITKIGDELFSHCSNLRSVVMEEGVTSIGGWTFFDCPSLPNINIPASVTSIGMDAFGTDEGLTAIFVGWDDPNIVNYASCCIFEGVNTRTITLHVPVGKKEAYQNHELWKDFTIADDGEKNDDGSYSAFLTRLTTNYGDFDSPNFLTVPESVSAINLIATPVDGATVSGDGQKTLAIGENNFEIVVTSKNGKIQSSYKIKIVRRETDYILDNISATSQTATFANGITIISGYKFKYRLKTGQYSSSLPLTFNVSLNGSQKTFNTNLPVNSYSIYEFVFKLDLNYDNPLSTTTYFDAFGRPTSTVIDNYDFHPCNIILSGDGDTLYAIDLNLPWTIENVSVTDFIFTGNLNSNSIQEPESQSSIRIYPTVTSDIIHIDNLQGETVQLYTLSGNLLFITSSSSLDLSSYPQGLYLVKIGNKVVKVIKK